MVDISKREEELPGTVMAKLLKIAEESKDIISLGPGEPDFCTPAPVRQAAKRALDACETHYSPPGGRTDFVNAICKKLKKENKINAAPENIVVGCGSQDVLFLAFMCTLDPGEQALIPNPSFLAYIPIVELLNAWPVSVPLREDEGWEINVDQLKKLINPKRTKVLMINSPANPTGNVLKKKTIEELAAFVIEHDLYVFSDEAYERFIYGKARHTSISSLSGMSNYVVTFHSFSKTWAMPGFRLGYAVAPPDLAQAMKQTHIYTSICAPTMSQLAGLKALKTSLKYTEKMRKEYDKRRKFIVRRLNQIGLKTVNPEGAFYTFSNIKQFGMSSNEFAEFLLKRAKVAVVPGTEFGKFGEGYIRCSYATSLDKIKVALDRVESALRKLT